MKTPGCVLVLALALSVGQVGPARADSLATQLERVADALTALQIDEARVLLDGLAMTHPEAPGVIFHRGLLAFYEGGYADAQRMMDQALAGPTEPAERRRFESMRDLVTSTLEVTRGLTSQQSSDGRYEVWFTPGPDQVLATYAMDVLKAADASLEAALGTRVPGRVRLEIFPSAHALAAVSALTVEQIETTGTIALSKWNRLMITTPRALVRGYPWADTITHEFVHMVLSRISHERAPVWLQEGTAKLLERSWRPQDGGMQLDPSSAAMLADARRDGKLLTFDEMHPSIAMLPSQEAAALAFAEVSTFMDRYVSTHGRDALQRALAAIADGTDARDALAAAAGVSFAELEKQWQKGLPEGPTGPNPKHLELRLKAGSGKPDEALDVDEDARRFMRLGDLLWDRGRTLAAKIEYQKAHRAAPDDPIVGSRLARTALSVGDATAARDAIAPLAARYPDHAPAHAVLGSAELALGNRARAARALREAIFINPFDPSPHCDLARATDSAAERARESDACRVLK